MHLNRPDSVGKINRFIKPKGIMTVEASWIMGITISLIAVVILTSFTLYADVLDYIRNTEFKWAMNPTYLFRIFRSGILK